MKRTFAIADLHGRYDLWEQVKAILNPEDEVYFLGDAIDRGARGYELMHELMFHPQVKYIKGNHEDLMQNALRSMVKSVKAGAEHIDTQDLMLWMLNGGSYTYNAWKKDGMQFEWMDAIKELPTRLEYISPVSGNHFILTHAGVTPGYIDNDYQRIWSRDHFFDPCIMDKTYISVHGHTPTPYLLDELEDRGLKEGKDYEVRSNCIFYGDGHKINIDCGAVFTGHAALLDLDSLEIINIYGDDYEE